MAFPTTLPRPGMMLSTPGGKPHSRAYSPNFSSESDVFDAGLMTTVLPHASAGAIYDHLGDTEENLAAIARLHLLPVGARLHLCARGASRGIDVIGARGSDIGDLFFGGRIDRRERLA